MTVPGRVAAAALLISLDPPPWFVAHARAVGEVAGWLAMRIADRGIEVDRSAVEAAALLHDVDKVLPADDPARRLPHGKGSAAWLTRHGHPELARAVADHPVTRLVDGDAYRRWAAFASREERIVAYADKRARPAPRIDGCPLRVVAPSPHEPLGRADKAGRPGSGRPPGGRRLPRGGRRSARRRAPALDQRGVARRPGGSVPDDRARARAVRVG